MAMQVLFEPGVFYCIDQFTIYRARSSISVYSTFAIVKPDRT